MQVDSLEELKRAFAQWRRGKRHARELMPEELVDRARRATKVHGVPSVARAIGVDRSRLFRSRPASTRQQPPMRTEPQQVPKSVPVYSRVELSAQSAPSCRPVAEVATGSGVTLRVFDLTPEMMGLLSAMCGIGGVR